MLPCYVLHRWCAIIREGAAVLKSVALAGDDTEAAGRGVGQAELSWRY